ncbi:uncharacterized protein B0H64DRAFT_441220 [Chaetomium fimeti]|uniref:Uncharacterized protein n=1 Tax=Chaetomium fimeti TaxID=1854472 RepID=A0AAE0HJP5_9PEZI|nr:hypothetical protein B0H64DRAFT_441220 [Chaetomium fimeti]
MATAAAIPDAVLRAVHVSDQAMYPVALPYARLRTWVDACPELSVCFREGGSNDGGGGGGGGGGGSGGAAVADAVMGVVIVLPLRKGCWEDLLSGRLKEPDIEPGSAFPGSGLGGCGGDEGSDEGGDGEGKEEVGLHVYHIERFETGCGGAGKKGFCEFALGEVMRRVQARPGWKVVGMSALTATPTGKRAFERLGFTPTGYRELFVVKAPEETSPTSIGKEGLDMVCLYPGDERQVVTLASAGDTVSVSEMTVNYNISPDTGHT